MAAHARRPHHGQCVLRRGRRSEPRGECVRQPLDGLVAKTAVIVAFGPGRWTPYLALVVPLVLGLGAIVAAVMTGAFIEQLTDIANQALLLSTLLHVAGLIAAVAGAVGMVQRRGAGPISEPRPGRRVTAARSGCGA